ncbi:lysine N(6)-hydroxylase/L-ornithine N(5)-oxygenase family protein [Azotobacter chroococcum]|uniref:lysine N(6)-hydroxylase/L-ornithine N(5)-oxygenase family protein n=1 Tax=Azotobacter chroococcum TaxID=353 RepID=UPI000B5E4BF6|nr:lysine N(6)-hydroxylase/L-ornithine N(5)-oxygenase family protein [Azotobacter chroococcum]ASL28334.1 ornithine monooxygenase [Azotobacter chroococcum]TBW10043.1 ornithine monooxygenase [Azotobacter chroococcum]
MSIETLEYDVIGVGFGPANLAIAIALEEDSRTRESGLRYCFLDSKPAFEWHGGMLLENSRMQISYLKDLATLRNPASRFTFVNYLHEKQRLLPFINLGSCNPSRIEYNDYLRWAAGHFAERVHYGEQVVAVEGVEERGEVQRLRVVSRLADGRTHTRLTRNLVVGIGAQAAIPELFAGLRGEPRLIHSSQYLERIGQCCPEREGRYRVAVLGSGQSAAEIYSDLAGRYPQAEISLVMRAQAMRPADDSPFVNEIFDPAFTDVVYRQPQAARQQLIRSLSHTNYSVVNLDLIESIYQDLYQQQVIGAEQRRLLANRQVQAVTPGADGLRLSLRDTRDGGEEVHAFDLLVLATGYRRDAHWRLLEGIERHLHKDAGLERSYRLPTRAGFQPNIFLQGCCEDSHGLSDTLLSVVAVRSQEVAEALLAACRQPQAACA